GLRQAVHGVDVAERVGGGDLAVDVGVIDDGREEIDGLNERNVLRQLEDAGVVVRFGADKQVGITDFRQGAQNLREARGGQFPCSAGAGGVVDEALLSAEKQHEYFLPALSWESRPVR